MPNLKTWIEAQLKRGYTRNQLKGILTKKGYSPTAVSQVDKADVHKEKKLNMAVLILLFVIISISLVFMFKQQDLVQQILQDEKIFDPQQAYTGFDTNLLFAHGILGSVVEINQNIIRLRVNESIITIPRTSLTADFVVTHFQVANDTRTIISPQAIGVGDVIQVGMYTDAVTYKPLGMTITAYK